MNTLTGYVIVAAIVLALAALTVWQHRGSNRFPLIILCNWGRCRMGDYPRFHVVFG